MCPARHWTVSSMYPQPAVTSMDIRVHGGRRSTTSYGIRRGGARPAWHVQSGRDTVNQQPSSHRWRPMGAALLLVSAGITTLLAPATPAAAAINAADFQQVTLAKGEAEVGEPLTISVLPDRSVL